MITFTSSVMQCVVKLIWLALIVTDQNTIKAQARAPSETIPSVLRRFPALSSVAYYFPLFHWNIVHCSNMFVSSRKWKPWIYMGMVGVRQLITFWCSHAKNHQRFARHCSLFVIWVKAAKIICSAHSYKESFSTHLSEFSYSSFKSCVRTAFVRHGWVA